MDKILSCMDQWSRTITLSPQAWNTHIQVEHPEFVEHVDSISETITSPSFVTYDAFDELTECFYRIGGHPRYDRLYVKECARFEVPSASTGIIVTAFLTSRIKRKERLKWEL